MGVIIRVAQRSLALALMLGFVLSAAPTATAESYQPPALDEIFRSVHYDAPRQVNATEFGFLARGDCPVANFTVWPSGFSVSRNASLATASPATHCLDVVGPAVSDFGPVPMVPAFDVQGGNASSSPEARPLLARIACVGVAAMATLAASGPPPCAGMHDIDLPYPGEDTYRWVRVVPTDRVVREELQRLGEQGEVPGTTSGFLTPDAPTNLTQPPESSRSHDGIRLMWRFELPPGSEAGGVTVDRIGLREVGGIMAARPAWEAEGPVEECWVHPDTGACQEGTESFAYHGRLTVPEPDIEECGRIGDAQLIDPDDGDHGTIDGTAPVEIFLLDCPLHLPITDAYGGWGINVGFGPINRLEFRGAGEDWHVTWDPELAPPWANASVETHVEGYSLRLSGEHGPPRPGAYEFVMYLARDDYVVPASYYPAIAGAAAAVPLLSATGAGYALHAWRASAARSRVVVGWPLALALLIPVLATALIVGLLRVDALRNLATFPLDRDGLIVGGMLLAVTVAFGALWLVAYQARTRHSRRDHRRLYVDHHELQRRTDELNQVLRGVGHDLKTPLLAMNWLTSDLANEIRSADPDEVRLAVERIQRNLAGMEDLVADLGALAHAEGPEGDLEDIDVRTLVERVAADLEGAAHAVDATIHVSPGKTPAVRGHAHLMRSLVQNLVSNALKYGPRGGMVKIRLVHPGSEPADEWRLEVEDEGPGVPDDQKEAIFGVFHRTPEAQASGVEGTGLGLALVARVAHAHGGTAHVEDIPGGGARFVVRFPSSIVQRHDPSR